mgnify:CR=1 FL=1|tara:strand:- start:358 stop:663 length:306 start_codon:yes stop_codon:yes gene_type:complete
MKNKTTFERIAIMGLTNKLDQYIVDTFGNLHYMGNPTKKHEAVIKSLKHWKNKLEDTPEDPTTIKFFNKFLHLEAQISILIESNSIVERKSKRSTISLSTR